MTSRSRRSAHTPAAKGGKWIHPATRRAIYERDGHRCVYCEKQLVAIFIAQQTNPEVSPPAPYEGRIIIDFRDTLSLDHVRPVVKHGRKNAPTNLVTCCCSCNSSKQGLSVRAWFARLRKRGIDTAAVRRRIRRQTAMPIRRFR